MSRFSFPGAPRPKRVRLAVGGHATVWLARSEGELVARKLPHSHLMDDPEMRAALRREAEIALRLRHPNVVRLRGIELEDEVPVLVMDYVEGTTLSELVRDWLKTNREDTARAALRIILDAAEGLHALHELRGERGEALALVHRDVSPQNVLVGLDGRARVSDFGLTKCLATDRATTEGVLKGKAGYLAPEYIRGERGDRRQDVFSLAICAWEALTKARLFRGENDAQTLDRVLTMPIPSIAEKAPQLSAAASRIDPVLARALARSPEDRYESAHAFAQALSDAATRTGLLGTELDVKASFSSDLTRDLEAKRASLEEKTSSGRLAVASVLGLSVFIIGTAFVVRTRMPPPRTDTIQGPTSTAETTAVQAPAPPASIETKTSASDVAPSASLEVMALPDAPKGKSSTMKSPARPVVDKQRPAPEPAKGTEPAPTGKPRPNPY